MGLGHGRQAEAPTGTTETQMGRMRREEGQLHADRTAPLQATPRVSPEPTVPPLGKESPRGTSQHRGLFLGGPYVSLTPRELQEN